jgi:neutral ceramidase
MSIRKLILIGLGMASVTAIAVQPTRGQRAETPLRAGAAKIDITPAEGVLHPTDTIRDHLFARAIVIREASSCAVLVGLDQGGARNELVRDAISRSSKAINCPEANFLISATHTHSGSTAGLGGGGDPTAKVVADAIVKAVNDANQKMVPARIAFGTTNVYLNVNRDLFDRKWLQAANPEAESDKTMAVVALIDNDNNPIAFYLNYAMHPINFYLTGIISADFPGQASRYIEQRYDDKTIAVFTQGASGNQNPLLLGPRLGLSSVRTRRPGGENDKFNQPTPYERTAGSTNYVNDATAQMDIPLKESERAAYNRAYERANEFVKAEGAIVGESAIDLFKNRIREAALSADIWAGETAFTCPGRDRLDNSVREGALPPYKDGAPVNLKVGLLRIGDINLVRVNGEVYNDISLHLKARSPAKNTVMVTLANGAANSGYIYSNAASPYLTFQVIGSRLKPYCAEDKIIESALDLMAQSQKLR